MKSALLVLAFVAAVSACSTHRSTRPAIAAAELAPLVEQAPSKTELITLHFAVAGAHGPALDEPIGSYPMPSANATGSKRKAAHRLPQITVRPNQKAMIEIIREFIYPVRLDLPKPARLPAELTPTTPTRFETRDVGWKIVDITFIPQGAFCTVHGRFVETTFDGFIDNPGDGFRPITGPEGRVLTDNRAQSPTFTTRETPFIVSALPGRGYRLPLNIGQRGATLEVRCVPIDRDVRPASTAVHTRRHSPAPSSASIPRSISGPGDRRAS